MKKFLYSWRLKGAYRKTYKQISLEIQREAQRSQQREQTLKEMENMLFQAQVDGTPLSAIFADGYDAFCRDISETLPRYTVEEKYYRHQQQKKRKIGISLAVSCVLVLFFLWNFGFLAYWFRGVPGLLEEENNFISSSHYTTGPAFSITIDLSNPDSNIGKVLIEDEVGKIVVRKVYLTNSDSLHNVYCVQFESIARHTMSHVQYYYPMVSRFADNSRNFGTVIHAGNEIPLFDRANGPFLRNSELFDMYTIEVDKNSVLEDPIITLIFDNFKIKEYTRIGWGRLLHID